MNIQQNKMNTRFTHQSEQFVREITYKGGGGLKRPAPFVGVSLKILRTAA